MLKRKNLREKKMLPFLCYSLPLHIYIDLYKYIQVTLGLPLWGFKIPSSSSKSGDLRHINDHRRTPYTPLIFFSALLPISTSCYVECSHQEKGLFSIFSSKLCFVFQGKSLRLRFPACIIMLGIFYFFYF